MREFVADLGNSRIKWGECASDRVIGAVAVPLDDPEVWSRQLGEMRESRWTLAGTHPDARDRLAERLRQHGNAVRILSDYRQLPLAVRAEHPEQVGIDRLLNAVAVLAKGLPAIIIDAGSAVTVDLVDSDGAFRGGAIFPGFRLMAKALNDYTARLPLVDHFLSDSPLPGTNTTAAINGGIANAVAGGIERIVHELLERFGPARVYLAGGDAELLSSLEFRAEFAGPYLTLEGIRITAQHLQ
jgi:type III pantothenate kinase